MRLFEYILDFLSVPVFYLSMIFFCVVGGGNEFSPSLPIDLLYQMGFDVHTYYYVSLFLAGICGALIWVINPFRENTKNKYGGAKWATNNEIKKMGLFEPKGIILGVKSGKYIRIDEPLSTLIYAPPGSGKTQGNVIPPLLTNDNSMIVHDPKGELFDKTNKRRELFSKIIKFSPGEEGSVKWNPFSKDHLPEKFNDIQTYCSRISISQMPTEKGQESMWIIEARSLFMFWSLYLIWKNGETSFRTILENILSDEDQQETIAEILDENSENDKFPSRIRLEGNSMIAKAEKEFAGVLSSCKSAMSVHLDENVAENMSASDFNIKDLRDETTTIYLCVKNVDQTRLSPLLTMFFEIATMVFLDHEPTKEEKSVTFMMDEFVRLGKMQELLEMPAIGRSYRFNCIYVCQSESQIVDIYGREGANKLKNTCAYHVVFAQNEYDVAEKISKSIGNRTLKKKSFSSQKGTFARGTSESEEGLPLWSAQDIQSMPFGDIFILKQNAYNRPVKCKSAFWFNDNNMKKLVE